MSDTENDMAKRVTSAAERAERCMKKTIRTTTVCGIVLSVCAVVLLLVAVIELVKLAVKMGWL